MAPEPRGEVNTSDLRLITIRKGKTSFLQQSLAEGQAPRLEQMPTQNKPSDKGFRGFPFWSHNALSKRTVLFSGFALQAFCLYFVIPKILCFYDFCLCVGMCMYCLPFSVCLVLFWFVCIYCFFKDACLFSMREKGLWTWWVGKWEGARKG